MPSKAWPKSAWLYAVEFCYKCSTFVHMHAKSDATKIEGIAGLTSCMKLLAGAAAMEGMAEPTSKVGGPSVPPTKGCGAGCALVWLDMAAESVPAK